MKSLRRSLVLITMGLTSWMASASPLFDRYENFRGAYSQSWDGAVATPEQNAFLERVRARVIRKAYEQVADTQAVLACLQVETACRELHTTSQNLEAILRRANARYRRLVFLSRIDDVRDAVSRHVFSPSPGLPRIQISNEERREVILMARQDLIAIDDHLGAGDRRPASQTRSSDREQLILESQELYRTQLHTLIGHMPLVVYIQAANPTREDLMRATDRLLQQQSRGANEIQRISDLRNFAYFNAAFEEERRTGNAPQSVSQSILAVAYRPQSLWTWISVVKANAPQIASYFCSLGAAVIGAWPVSVICGAFGAAVSARFVQLAAMRDGMERRLMLLQLRSLAQMEAARADLVFQIVVASVVGYGLVSTINTALTTPFREALRTGRESLHVVSQSPRELASRVGEWAKGLLTFDAHVQILGAAANGNGTRVVRAVVAPLTEARQLLAVAMSHDVLTMADYLRIASQVQSMNLG